MLTLMPKVKRRGKVLYLKSMDSFMDELSKKYKDLSKGLSHEEILSHGFSIEHISKECRWRFGLTADISNHTLETNLFSQMDPYT
jgi:hypothetical protein